MSGWDSPGPERVTPTPQVQRAAARRESSGGWARNPVPEPEFSTFGRTPRIHVGAIGLLKGDVLLSSAREDAPALAGTGRALGPGAYFQDGQLNRPGPHNPWLKPSHNTEARPAAADRADEAAAPGDEAAAPSDDAAALSDETAAPGDEAAAPGDEAAAPGDEAAAPSDEAAAPGDEAAAPGDAASSHEAAAGALPAEDEEAQGSAGDAAVPATDTGDHRAPDARVRFRLSPAELNGKGDQAAAKAQRGDDAAQGGEGYAGDADGTAGDEDGEDADGTAGDEDGEDADGTAGDEDGEDAEPRPPLTPATALAAARPLPASPASSFGALTPSAAAVPLPPSPASSTATPAAGAAAVSEHPSAAAGADLPLSPGSPGDALQARLQAALRQADEAMRLSRA